MCHSIQERSRWRVSDRWVRSIPVAMQHQIGLRTPVHQQLPHGRHQLALYVIAGNCLQTVDISLKRG